MIPAPFDYVRPGTLEEALAALAAREDAKLLGGGHSLVPAMKLRLAQPRILIDLGGIANLSYISQGEGRIAIGAMTTHHAIESSPLVAEKCPLMCEVAGVIGDVQVRNCGTLGGSLAHADPAADWPAAILALDAELETAGPHGGRVIQAKDFFVDLYQTALEPNEILKEIRVPATSHATAYEKTFQRASGFAIAGVAVVWNAVKETVSVAVTGVAAKAYRAVEVERSLRGKPLTQENIRAAATKAAEDVEALGDIHASADYRSHLACVNARRALERAAARS